MLFAGIDAGSHAIKVVIIENNPYHIIASGIIDQGVKQEELAEKIYHDVLEKNKISGKEIKKIISTGYGRNIINFSDLSITEITCHARGVFQLIPQTRTIIDIGGQDSKLILINNKGHVEDFMMNDRCAAGTGRFLEIIAERLNTNINEIGALASKSKKPKTISSMCVVFAETEIIGLLASGTNVEDIIAGVLKSISSRIVSMGGRLIKNPIVFTGGVALLPGMKESLETALKSEILIPQIPQMTGALGAALLASEKFSTK